MRRGYRRSRPLPARAALRPPLSAMAAPMPGAAIASRTASTVFQNSGDLPPQLCNLSSPTAFERRTGFDGDRSICRRHVHRFAYRRGCSIPRLSRIAVGVRIQSSSGPLPYVVRISARISGSTTYRSVWPSECATRLMFEASGCCNQIIGYTISIFSVSA